ncbi:1,4-alpha-glucan branching enzyme [Mycobacteroides chelonae]|uniref:1,4-alpha-glucan branching enzyme n=1 Tax=Mycobacteroides chelonae TaxID=1774 RepID=UPI0009947C54|nr:1,4-alpha-glucan branching enzyme [Mycobacteroides chelonae]
MKPDAADLARLVAGTHHNPHSILGAHEYANPGGKGHTVIRAFKPGATAVAAVVGDELHPMADLGSGLFGVALPFLDLLDYRLDVDYNGTPLIIADAYRFLPTLGEVDLHLFNEGRHERLWEILGAHPRSFVTADGEVSGISFAVWAPNAHGVSVIGDFNGWNGNDAPMRTLGSSGVWELFWPGMTLGSLYKFRVHGADGSVTDRADPFAFATELPPATASRVTTSSYSWQDEEWMTRRTTGNPVFEPMSTYEVHLASWRPGLSYRELARELTDYVLAQGFTHVELLPVAEHPFGGSWGYQVTSYYAPTSRLGTPDDFRYLVDALHRAGIGVIVDWVPAHFPKDAWALARFDGTPLYEHADPHRAEQLDWGTYVFDFGRPEVRNFLVANALFWLDQFHIDGLRVDAVASMLYLDYSRPAGGWTPNIHGGRENLEAVQFLQEMNATVHKLHPGIVTVAEESTSWPGVTRATSLGGLGAKAAGLRCLLAYMWAHPGKQLLFMGQEFGQRAEWSDERGVDWFQLGEDGYSSGIAALTADLNSAYQQRRALWSQDTAPQGYSWIDANDSANNVLSFLRFGDDGSVLACIFNFAGIEHASYRVGLPLTGRWREVINTDALQYHGSGVGNLGEVIAEANPWHGRPASATLALPPAAAIWLEPISGDL